MIVRISYPYRKTFELKKDFVRTIRSLLEQHKPLTMVADSLMTPTLIDDIGYALKYLFMNFSGGVFHINGADSLSPYDAGKLIAKTYGLDQNLITPTTYEKYFQGKAFRSQYSDMKSRKIIFIRCDHLRKDSMNSNHKYQITNDKSNSNNELQIYKRFVI